jgi:hypothetical protein
MLPLAYNPIIYCTTTNFVKTIPKKNCPESLIAENFKCIQNKNLVNFQRKKLSEQYSKNLNFLLDIFCIDFNIQYKKYLRN